MPSGPTEHESKAARQDGAEVSMLDQALWTRFDDARPLVELAQVWLALQMRQLGVGRGGLVVLDVAGADGMVPVARWPLEKDPDAALAQAVEAALELERGVARGSAVAEPLHVDGEICGVVALAAEDREPAALLRGLRWGKGWLLSALRRELTRSEAADRSRMSAAFDVIGAVLDTHGFAASALQAVNLLARRMDCSQVALGRVKRRRVRLEALSDVAELRWGTDRSQALEQAMAEAVDQEGPVLYPRREGARFMVTLAHAKLAEELRGAELLTLPLFAGERLFGLLHFQKRPGDSFSDEDILVGEAVAAAIGPLLHEKRRNDRGALRVVGEAVGRQVAALLGPRHVGRKVAALILIGAVAALTFIRADYRVSAQAEVQGQIVRSISAPFDGHVRDEFARAGDVLSEGDVIARLDDRDLQIELVRWQTDLGRYRGEYDRALAERDAPTARIAEANIRQATAKADLVERQLERTALVAPFDAVVIEGDLSQALGSAVRRGEELFKLAPLDSYRVALEVEEETLDDVAVGQSGQLVLAAIPEETVPVKVTLITPRLVAEDGRNFAVVEAQVLGDIDAMRPGMRGVAKIEVEERRLIDLYTRPILDWLRLALWRWTP